MKILIAYTGKTGTTEECISRLIADLHELQAEAVNLEKDTPDPADYDIVVLGAPIRFGRLPKVMKKYIKQYHNVLCKVPHGLFLCCGLAHEYEYYVEKQYDKELRNTAFLICSFGGTLRYENQRFWEKLLIHQIRSSIMETEIEDGEYTPTLPGILPENIGKMATYIRAEAERQRKM